MKNLKVLTVAMLLGASTVTYTSCGGTEGAKDEKSAESKDGASTDNEAAAIEIDLDKGLGHIQLLVQSLESDAIAIDKASMVEVQEHFNFEDKYGSEDRISSKSSLAGYSVSKSYTFYKDQLNSTAYSSFYDEDRKDQAADDCDAIQAYLTETFGKPESKKYPKWETDKYSISFSSYDDGYSLDIKSANVDKTQLDIEDNMIAGGSVDEITRIITALSDGSIVMKTTTPEELATKLNMEANDYYMVDKIQYSDHSLSRNIDIDSKTVSKIKLYNYNNPKVDTQEDMNNVDAYLVATLGDDFVGVGEQKIWKKDNYTVSFTLYTYGGYDMTIE